MAMNPEIREQWVAALRSGEYEQGAGYLAQIRPEGNQYCCLGVLCELAADAGIVQRKRALSDTEEEAHTVISYYDEHRDYDNSIAMLPMAVRRWAAIPSVSPSIVGIEGGEPVQITELNDGLGYTFTLLADLIEEQF